MDAGVDACLVEPQKNVRLQWEKRHFLNKKKKIAWEKRNCGKEQRCIEGLLGCLTMYIPFNFRFFFYKTDPVKSPLFINIFRVSL